jgi:hypothetical protein
MPVFNFDLNRSVTNLDLRAARSGIFTPSIDSLELHDEKLRRFNELIQRVAPGKPAFSADQIAGAARRVLRASMKGQESPFIRSRMRRAGEMRAALEDAQWEIPARQLAAMREVLDYLEDIGRQLIPNSMPVIGLLDDAILIDAAMDLLRGELDDYADFCRYRTAEAANLGVAPGELAIDRRHWNDDRQQERRVEQQLQRLRDSGSGRVDGDLQARFRFC